jgi:phenylacetate-CoA ligase
MLRTFDPWRSWAVATDVALATRASPKQLEARRERRLRELFAAAQRSPLYRQRFAGIDAARVRLHALPPVHKTELMHRFDEWVTDPALELGALRRFVADPANIGKPFAGRYVVWESSGSSGEPGIFVQDAAAMAVYDALEALRRPAPEPMRRALDPWYLGERIAFVGAIGGHFASVVANARLRQINPACASTLHDVSFLQPLPAIDTELDAWSPTILGTYPTSAQLLAEERAAGRLEARPREVWTGGETLTPAMRRFIADTFGCTVVDSYGASEFFTLACECSRGSLHLNSDWAILEPVDERGRPVPAGEPGASVLLTNLANHVQPLIRYDLGDRVVMRDAPCSCGSALPVIEVQGRRDDTLHLVCRDRTVPVAPLAVSTVLEEQAGLFDFRLEQTGPARLSLSTATKGQAAALARARAALSVFLADQGAPTVAISTHTDRARRCGRSGKVQRIVSLQSHASQARARSRKRGSSGEALPD